MRLHSLTNSSQFRARSGISKSRFLVSTVLHHRHTHLSDPCQPSKQTQSNTGHAPAVWKKRCSLATEKICLKKLTTQYWVVQKYVKNQTLTKFQSNPGLTRVWPVFDRGFDEKGEVYRRGLWKGLWRESQKPITSSDLGIFAGLTGVGLESDRDKPLVWLSRTFHAESSPKFMLVRPT